MQTLVRRQGDCLLVLTFFASTTAAYAISRRFFSNKLFC